MDIVSIRDLSREQIEEVMERSERMIPYARGEKASKALDGKILATLFFEPSTRTRMSFESAMMRLGGRITDLGVPSMSSISKGESLADTIRMVEVYSDIIVIRHPREGAARLAARFSSKPVINAGDGAGQHPTQTLLDLFTIKRIKKDFNKLNVVMVGDLKYGRTVHSLAEALSSFGVELTFVAPAALQMPKETVRQVERMGGRPKLTNRLEETIADADVLYVTRIQKERFPDLAEYQKVAGMYRVDRRLLREAKSDLIVLHPLPRVDEIDPEVDGTPHAKYFEQAFNGVPVRMALLNLVLGGEL
ncbi:MAG TPA: aspartate carbamoyltransferase [Methanomassiliicoccales archaeon]|nr:aspartate carbamoyltransferase [Methanomassiliicoccales archaeon]HOO04211.1 aspartate carbamoyltransferase [Methanomassiliicoccales archaeon]